MRSHTACLSGVHPNALNVPAKAGNVGRPVTIQFFKYHKNATKSEPAQIMPQALLRLNALNKARGDLCMTVPKIKSPANINTIVYLLLIK